LKRPFSVAFQPREKNTHSTLGNIAVWQRGSPQRHLSAEATWQGRRLWFSQELAIGQILAWWAIEGWKLSFLHLYTGLQTRRITLQSCMSHTFTQMQRILHTKKNYSFLTVARTGLFIGFSNLEK
jgi:hypothetical protein